MEGKQCPVSAGAVRSKGYTCTCTFPSLLHSHTLRNESSVRVKTLGISRTRFVPLLPNINVLDVILYVRAKQKKTDGHPFCVPVFSASSKSLLSSLSASHLPFQHTSVSPQQPSQEEDEHQRLVDLSPVWQSKSQVCRAAARGRERDAVWRTCRAEGEGAEAREGRGEKHSGRLSGEPPKVSV